MRARLEARAQELLTEIKDTAFACGRELTFMEVCGTHTMAISRFGIRRALDGFVNLISGPGCPVCVTDQAELDLTIELARRGDLTIATFGDMVRVPGTESSLMSEKANGGDVRVVYSPLDALELAKHSSKRVVFVGVGFETTAPAIAVCVKRAKSEGLKNFQVLSFHKLIPPAMLALSRDPELSIDGYICPGHVSTVIGSAPYEQIARDCQIPCVIAGFEPLDILEAISMLCKQVANGVSEVQTQYKRAVRPEGNPTAQSAIGEVFEVGDAWWRGLGMIPDSGLQIRKKYEELDAVARLELEIEHNDVGCACRCGEVLKGKMRPFDCKLFATVCTPDDPVGPCMVSSEGTCAAYYRYERARQ